METRKEYIEKLAARLRVWDARIDELKGQVETATGSARLRYRTRLVEIRELRDRAAVMLEELREASGSAWKDVGARLDRLIEDVRKSLKKAA